MLATDSYPYPKWLGVDWPTAITIALTLSAALFALAAVILVLGGLYAFINFREIARIQAKQTAKETAERMAEEAANRYIQENLPAIIRAYAEVNSFGLGASGEQADEIAQEESTVQDHETDNGDSRNR